jgi:hypothetical protein
MSTQPGQHAMNVSSPPSHSLSPSPSVHDEYSRRTSGGTTNASTTSVRTCGTAGDVLPRIVTSLALNDQKSFMWSRDPHLPLRDQIQRECTSAVAHTPTPPVTCSLSSAVAVTRSVAPALAALHPQSGGLRTRSTFFSPHPLARGGCPSGD